MQENERQLIDKLFGQLGEAARQTTNRDPEADRYIRQLVQRQPELLYNMVQTLILQQKALQNAKARIESLQRDKGAQQAPAPAQLQKPSQGSSFLAGAAETAVGVAGGMFLADAVGSIFDSVDLDVAADAVDDAYEAGLEDAADLDDDFGFDDLDFDF
jgi:hypothetical protein